MRPFSYRRVSDQEQALQASGSQSAADATLAPELGNVGMNAAVANALSHATGVRVRKLPIRLEHLIV